MNVKRIYVETERSTLQDLTTTIWEVCPWLEGQLLHLSYPILRTHPKSYNMLRTEEEFVEMKKMYENTVKVEVYVISQNVHSLNMEPSLRPNTFRGGVGHHQGHLQYEDIEYADFEDTYVEPHSNRELVSYEVTDVGDEDDADDCYSEEQYHSRANSHEDSNVELENVASYDGDLFDLNLEDPPMEVGTKFIDAKQFRTCLRQHAIKKNFEVHLVKNDKDRVTGRCSAEGCTWRVHASKTSDGVTFEIKTIKDEHTCKGVNKVGNTQASQSWIAQFIAPRMVEKPTITVKEIKKELMRKYGLSVPYHRVYRGKKEAYNNIHGSVEKSFSYIPSLKTEIEARDPRSVVQFEKDEHNRFERFFVCYGACAKGFLSGCNFIGIDACHLKGKYLGMLLSATALDGNNGLFPIAFACVESENGNAWKWFLELLVRALDGDIQNLTIMSDQDKGIVEPINIVMPGVEHRICMRYLYKNFKKDFQGAFYERVVWMAAKAFTEAGYQATMRELKENSPTAWKILDENKTCWRRSLYSEKSKNHYMTNNLSESFNTFALDARLRPCVDLIDTIRQKIMTKMNMQRRQATKLKGKLVPMAQRYIVEISKNIGGYQVLRSSDVDAEVQSPYERCEVNLEQRICTCRRWQLTGLPCIYAADVIGSMRRPPWENYVDEFYTIEKYKAAYSESFPTLPSKDTWASMPLLATILAPKYVRPRGRPKKRRYKGKDERSETKLSKKQHRCKRCLKLGHHQATCKATVEDSNNQAEPSVEQRRNIEFMGRDNSKGKRGRSTPIEIIQSQGSANNMLEGEEPSTHRIGRSLGIKRAGRSNRGTRSSRGIRKGATVLQESQHES